MRIHHLVLVLLASFTLGFAALPSTALGTPPVGEGSPMDAFEGSYRFAGGEPERARVHTAIERVVQEMNFFIRDFARSAIRRQVRPETQLRFAVEGDDHVTVDLGDWRSPTVSVRGQPRTAIGPDGNRTRFSVRHGNARLYVRSATEQGTREAWMSLGPNRDTLRVQIQVSSPRLPSAIRYDLTYRRVPVRVANRGRSGSADS